METSGFLYNLEWLSLYIPGNMAIFIVVLLWAILLIVILWGPYVYWYWLIRADERAIREKKSILWDLVLMKDIQTELDAEIEEMMLASLMKKWEE